MLRKALAASDGPPKTITTDKWRAYLKPIKELVPEAKHIQSEGLAAEVNNNLSRTLAGDIPRQGKDVCVAWKALRPGNATLTDGRSITTCSASTKA